MSFCRVIDLPSELKALEVYGRIICKKPNCGLDLASRSFIYAPLLFDVVVVWRLHYINTLKYELSGTKAYKETSEEEKSVVNGYCNHLALKFSVCVKERQDRLPTMYWLPKLHKKNV